MYVCTYVCMINVYPCCPGTQDPDDSSIYYHPVYYTLNEDRPELVTCRSDTYTYMYLYLHRDLTDLNNRTYLHVRIYQTDLNNQTYIE